MSEHDDLLAAARLRSMPIDMEALIRDGVLERHGKRYHILDHDRLPEHAKRRFGSVRVLTGGTWSVTFKRINKKIAREYERQSGKRLPETPGGGV